MPPALTPSQDLAVELYRQMTGLPVVSPALAGLIGEAGIESEGELEFWQVVVSQWLGCGWSPKNVAGMLDYYRRAEVPSTRSGSGRETRLAIALRRRLPYLARLYPD